MMLWMESTMKLTLLMGAGTIFAAANLRGYGVYWAQAVCADAGNLCDHSWYFVIAGLRYLREAHAYAKMAEAVRRPNS